MTKKSPDKFKIYKNVFDNFTLNTLFKLSTKGYFDELISPLMIGKESNVFLDETKKKKIVVVKIYRLHSCNFNQMYSYIHSDPRFMEIKNQRRLVIFKWVQREYKNLQVCHPSVQVPKPFAFLNNVIVMESIGENIPSSQLKDAVPQNLVAFSQELLIQIKKMITCGIVHGDLSAFNILNHKESPYLIDFSQATSIKDSMAKTYLKRDIKNIVQFFKKYDLILDNENIYTDLCKALNNSLY